MFQNEKKLRYPFARFQILPSVTGKDGLKICGQTLTINGEVIYQDDEDLLLFLRFLGKMGTLYFCSFSISMSLSTLAAVFGCRRVRYLTLDKYKKD